MELFSTIVSIVVALAGFGYALSRAKDAAGKDSAALYDTWAGSSSSYRILLASFSLPYLSVNLLSTVMAVVMGAGFSELLQPGAGEFLGIPAGVLHIFLLGWWALTYGTQWCWYNLLFSGKLGTSKMVAWTLVGLFGAMTVVSFAAGKPIASALFAVHTAVSGLLAYYQNDLASKNPGV